MYSLKNTGSSLVTMLNTTSLPRRGDKDRYSSNAAFRVRTRASISTLKLPFAPRTGAGRSEARRNAPSVSSVVSFARYLPSTNTFTRSSDTRSACLMLATTPYWYKSFCLGSSVTVSCCVTKNTWLLWFIAHSTAAMLFLRPTSKCTTLLGNTTSPRSATTGRRSSSGTTVVIFIFSDILKAS